MMNNCLYLIDGNAYIHRAFYAVPMLTTSHHVPANAVYGFLRMMIKILNKEQPSHCVVCFDAPAKTFRHELFEAYKAHRQKMPDELVAQIPLVKEAVDAMGLHQIEMSGFEADDVIATLAHHATHEKMRVVIVSGDKDMLQLVNDNVTVYAAPKEIVFDVAGIEKAYSIPAKYIRDFFALVGDASDNVPGVPGIGKVTAAHLITQYGGITDLLANLSRLPQKVREKIEPAHNTLRMSYQLVSLDSNVPLAFEKDTYRIGALFEGAPLKSFLEKMEFTAMRTMLYGSEKKPDENSLFEVHTPTYPDASHETLETCDAPAVGIAYEYPSDETVTALIVYAPGHTTWRLPIADIACIAQSKKTLCLENAKTFLALCAAHNVICTAQLFDVVAAAYLLNSSLQNLDDVIKEFLRLLIEKQDTRERAHHTYELFPILSQQLCTENLDTVYHDIELPFCAVLADMERRGIKVDIPYLRSFSSKLEEDMYSLEQAIYREAGVFNINSPKQLATILFEKMGLPVIEKTKTGQSTAEHVLKQLAQINEFPKKIIAYRELAKLKTTYVDVMPKLADPATARVHTSFNYTNTATGRLSSSNPNLQNIPIKTALGRAMRKAFVADNGFVLVSCDYAQIDLVLLAHIANDAAMCQSFLDNKDIHTQTASEIFSVPEDAVTKTQRDMAKRINFGIVYGISAFGLSKDIGIPVDEAKRFIDAYFKRYPSVKTYMDSMIAFAKDKGYVQTIFGRRRYISEVTNANHTMRMLGERLAINTPIQGSSSDVIKKAMVTCARVLMPYRDDARMLLQIHDEILFEIRREKVDEVVPLITESMEHAVELCVPLRVSVKQGTNWEELK